MTQYMFMLFDDEKWYDTLSDEGEWEAGMQLHNDFAKAVQAAGATITGGAALLRATTATTVRKPGGEPLVTDGPFIETKEALGGFYLIDCKDLDQALELAKVCPGGAIEVRPVMDTSEGSAPPEQ